MSSRRIGSLESIGEIRIGDIHYEFEYGMGIRSEVISLPVLEGEMWAWKSRNTRTGEIIEYGITPGYAHYGPKLYNYEAYTGVEYV